MLEDVWYDVPMDLSADAHRPVATIVEGGEADLPRALDLDLRAHRARSTRHEQPADLRDILAERMRLPRTTLFLALVGEACVGTAFLRTAQTQGHSGAHIEDLAHISLVSVEPSMWG